MWRGRFAQCYLHVLGIPTDDVKTGIKGGGLQRGAFIPLPHMHVPVASAGFTCWSPKVQELLCTLLFYFIMKTLGDFSRSVGETVHEALAVFQLVWELLLPEEQHIQPINNEENVKIRF